MSRAKAALAETPAARLGDDELAAAWVMTAWPAEVGTVISPAASVMPTAAKTAGRAAPILIGRIACPALLGRWQDKRQKHKTARISNG